MFIDTAQVKVKAGKGGDGTVSFRREKFVDRGGPDGGDGGDGGSVIAVGSQSVNGLGRYRYQRLIRAQAGEPGGKQRRHGHTGADIELQLPLGTQIWEGENQVGDLTSIHQRVILARGGKGGYGNAHFTSSVRQAPRVAERGESGEEKELRLELKLIADVGLIGLPNAGKSTFLSVVSNARPKIADYPFTTLTPNLGVVDVDDNTMVIADIPGLIEGAAEGKGLGLDFLRHVERTAVLLHLIDIAQDDILGSYDTINQELSSYSKVLKKKPQVIALTKVDAVDESSFAAHVMQLENKLKASVFVISSVKKQGTRELLRELQTKVLASRFSHRQPQKSFSSIPVLTLEQKGDAWQVTKTSSGFKVTGHKIEKFAARTDFSSKEGVSRLKDIMRKLGITHELRRQGAQPGDRVLISRYTISY